MRWLANLITGIFLCSYGALAVRSIDTQDEVLLPGLAQKRGAACISAAAHLGSCLAAVSPTSKLTTIEESDCCAGLLAFQQAQCYCLPPQSLNSVAKGDRWAYRRRLNSLHKVHQRCGWEAFTCPGHILSNKYLGVDVDTKASEKVSSASNLPSWLFQPESEEETYDDALSWEPELSSSSSSKHELRGSQRSLGSSPADSARQRKDMQISELSDYVTAAVDLADTMSQAQDAQIEISIEMVVESSREIGAEHSLSGYRSCLYKVLLGGWRPEWMSLNFWLGLTVLVLLAALVVSLLQRRQSKEHIEPSVMDGIVLAASEAACYRK